MAFSPFKIILFKQNNKFLLLTPTGRNIYTLQVKAWVDDSYPRELWCGMANAVQGATKLTAKVRL